MNQLIMALTGFFIAWQAYETRRAAQAARDATGLARVNAAAALDSSTAAKNSAAAAKMSADALINSERAWLMVDLGSYDTNTLRVTENTSRSGSESEIYTTSTSIKLTCRNDGRSPAWIEKVLGRIDIAASRESIEADPPHSAALDHFGPMEPIGPGREKSRSLQLNCPGHRKPGEFLCVYIIVEYRDIFDVLRQTTCGYSVDYGGGIYRQDGLPNRNTNT